jgi:hypothetical protein
LGKKVVGRIVQQPGEPPPDVDALDAKIPKSEWEENPFGEPKGQLQYSVFMVDPKDGSKIVSSNSTFGQKAAFDELKDRVKFMRNLRGARVVPVVELSSKQMKTRFGVKIRPHFEIVDWRNFGPPAPAIAAPVDPPKDNTVAKPIAAEIVNDAIPWDDPVPDLNP